MVIMGEVIIRAIRMEVITRTVKHQQVQLLNLMKQQQTILMTITLLLENILLIGILTTSIIATLVARIPCQILLELKINNFMMTMKTVMLSLLRHDFRCDFVYVHYFAHFYSNKLIRYKKIRK